MSLEVNLNKRKATVELLYQEDNTVRIAVDNTVYELDIVRVEEGVYSILLNNRSYTIELFQNGGTRSYIVNTYLNTYDIEIIDTETKYLRSREKSVFGSTENNIYSPMPGKVVRIPVKVGEQVTKGQTVIVVSAMKMESEFKAKNDGVVRDILTAEGATVNGNQILVVIG
jgi:acetyl/propionyl-CoA carboxylase alpha subunit